MSGLDLAFEGALLFVWLLVFFALLSTAAEIAEWAYRRYQQYSRSREDLLPPPNVRSQRRPQQWRVPL